MYRKTAESWRWSNPAGSKEVSYGGNTIEYRPASRSALPKGKVNFNFAALDAIYSESVSYDFPGLLLWCQENIQVTRELALIFYTNDRRIVDFYTIGQGGPTECLIHPLLIFGPMVVYDYKHCFFLHNHPSGHPKPSNADQKITQRIVEAAEILDYNMLGNVIFCRDRLTAFGPQRKVIRQNPVPKYKQDLNIEVVQYQESESLSDKKDVGILGRVILEQHSGQNLGQNVAMFLNQQNKCSGHLIFDDFSPKICLRASAALQAPVLVLYYSNMTTVSFLRIKKLCQICGVDLLDIVLNNNDELVSKRDEPLGL